MSDLDRIFAKNQDSNRINQAKQIAVTAANIAMLAVGIHGKGVLGKMAGNMPTPPPGTIFDVKGKEMAAKLAADAVAQRTKEEVAKTVLNKNVGTRVKETLKNGFDKAKATTKKLDKEKILSTLKKGAEVGGKGALSGVRSEVISEVKKQLPPEATSLLEAQGKLSGIRNSLNAFKTTLHVDANVIINTISKITLGKPELTRGVVGYTNKVLTGTVGPGKSTLKAQEMVATMTDLENKTNGVVEKNLKILKTSGIKDLPAKAVTKKEQEAVMQRQVPDKILKETDWLKNKTEFLTLRSDIDGLGSKIVAINRGSFHIAKETENLRLLGEQQEDLLEQVKTFVQHDNKLDLISNKTPEEIMNKNFLTSLDIPNVKYAYKMVDDYARMGTRKNLLTGELQAQLTEGSAQMGYLAGRTTSDLLADTKKMLENSKQEAEDEERSEAAIKRMLKA